MIPLTRPAGVTAMAVFFAASTLISFVSALALLVPETALDGIWRLNPDAHEALIDAGRWGIGILFMASVGCAVAATGLWLRRVWGRRLGIGLMVAAMLGAFGNVFFRGDGESLVGLPIAGILTAYLMSERARRGESHPVASA
jgi:hypothetical protein